MPKKTNTARFFENAESLDDQSQEVSLSELISPIFLAKCSNFTSLEEMLDSSGIDSDNAEEFFTVHAEQWDKFVAANTTYTSWEDMLGSASSERAAAFVVAHLSKGFE